MDPFVDQVFFVGATGAKLALVLWLISDRLRVHSVHEDCYLTTPRVGCSESKAVRYDLSPMSRAAHPRSANSRSKAVTAISSRVVSRASHMRRKREALVCDREGIAAAAVAELELALEIGAPQIIGRQGL